MKRFLTIEWAASVFAAVWGGIAMIALLLAISGGSLLSSREFIGLALEIGLVAGMAFGATQLSLRKRPLRDAEVGVRAALCSAIIFSALVAACTVILLAIAALLPHPLFATLAAGIPGAFAVFAFSMSCALIVSAPCSVAGAFVFYGLRRLAAQLLCHCHPTEAKP